MTELARRQLSAGTARGAAAVGSVSVYAGGGRLKSGLGTAPAG